MYLLHLFSQDSAGLVSRYRNNLLLVCLLLLLGAPLVQDAAAQFSDTEAAERVPPGRATNIFTTWDGRVPIDGLMVDLPRNWKLQRAAALQFGADPVAATVRADSRGQGLYTVAFGARLEVPHELVVQVLAPSGLQTPAQWTITPFRMERGSRRLLSSHALSQKVRAAAEGPVARNHVLRFQQHQQRTSPTPLLVDAQALPSLESPYRLSLWLRTTGLDEVVLSTWTGREEQPYALDLVIDAAGRLRVYRGRPGRHWLLRSSRPVADGSWHRIVVDHMPATGWRMRVDEQTVDSLAGPLASVRADAGMLAVGGRIPSAGAPGGARPYTGMIDDLVVTAIGNASSQQMRLTFESEAEPAAVRQWPERLERVPQAVGRATSPVELHAELQEGAVALSWTGTKGPGIHYVVERSLDGANFAPIGRKSSIEGLDMGGQAAFYHTDAETPGDVLYYRVRQVRPSGEQLSHTIKIGIGSRPGAPVTLIGNFPNPFEGQTTISYDVHEAGPVQLMVWTLYGQRLTTLVDREHAPGHYEIPFSAGDFPSGTYLLVLHTSEGSQTHKMILFQ